MKTIGIFADKPDMPINVYLSFTNKILLRLFVIIQCGV